MVFHNRMRQLFLWSIKHRRDGEKDHGEDRDYANNDPEDMSKFFLFHTLSVLIK